MPRSVKLAIAAGIIAAAIAPSLNAHTALMPCNGTVTTIEIPFTGYIYVDERPGPPGETHWVYLERNSHTGLQSGGARLGESPKLGYDPCVNNLGEHANRRPDTLLL